MSAHDCIVVGSGPSGVACATALLERGRSVLMLDAGLTLEPERAETVRAARAGAETLRPESAAWMGEAETDEAIPRKLLFGSDFPYRDAHAHMRLNAKGIGVEPSFARGGLSNVWGASVMPYADRDMRDWPIRTADLEPHYLACARMLAFSGEEDDLARDFPLYGPPSAQLNASVQARTLLSGMARSRAVLAERGFLFGRARVAIRARDCIYCGLCLGGCPDALIYSANEQLDVLAANPRFSYEAGIVVDRVADGLDAAQVQAHGLAANEPLNFAAKRVFVAAGVIPTTAILMRSGGVAKVRLKDSQYFLLPLMRPLGAGRVREERLFTLCQAFIEIVDPALGPYTTHLQLYSYNSLMAAELRKRAMGLAPLARMAETRLMLIQGYLHSALSSEIVMSQNNWEDEIRLRPDLNPRTAVAIGRVVNKLLANAHRIGAAPVPPLLRIGEPGRGFHVGGSFPMRAAPGGAETDLLGRPFGWARVHAVDASILPSIAATTITFTVMANAHRIGCEAAAIED